MDDIYMLADSSILDRIGNHLRQVRLKQNITQQSLSEAAEVSLSSLKKIEKGEICSFDSFLRVLRTLGLLDVLKPLVEEERMSPNEYYQWMHSGGGAKQRKRAVGKLQHRDKEQSSW